MADDNKRDEQDPAVRDAERETGFSNSTTHSHANDETSETPGMSGGTLGTGGRREQDQ